MLEQQIEIQSRLFAKVVRDLLHCESFESLADLTEAVKVRCGKLRIRWTNEDLSAAFAMIASNTTLVQSPVPVPDIREEPPPLSRSEAADTYQTVMARYARAHVTPLQTASAVPENFPTLIEVSTWY